MPRQGSASRSPSSSRSESADNCRAASGSSTTSTDHGHRGTPSASPPPMDNGLLALVVIAAIFIGVLIPVLTQLRSTLRTFERLVQENEVEVRRAVVELGLLSHRLNHLGE